MPDHLDFDATLQKLVAGAVVFDRYLLKRLIGKGRFGDVWEATDQRLEHSVVLKLLVNYPHYDRLLAGAGRFTNLTHPNIVRIFDFIGDGQLSALVMEHVQGQSVAALLREKQPPFFEAADVQPWVRDLFAALDHAWKNGRLVHGDIRPANLLITKSGLLKVAEFPFATVREGLAIVSSHESDTDGGSLSLPCLSPQVISGEPALHSDDVYSAGASVYEMLTGKPVFPGGNLMTQIQRKVPPTVTERRVELERKGAAVPKTLEQLTARCLAKEREDRPSSAADVVALLQLSVTTSTKGRLKQATRSLVPSSDWIQFLRHPWMVMVGALIVLAGAFFFLVIKPGGEEVQRRKAEYDKLVAVDVLGEAEPDKRLAEWQTFLNKYYVKDVMFTDEDDRLNELATTNVAKWKSANEEFRKTKREEASAILEKEDALDEDLRELKKTPTLSDADVATLTAHLGKWTALLSEHDVKESPKTDDFKEDIEEAVKERDKVQALLVTAQKNEKEKVELEKAMEAAASSWAKQWRTSLDALKSTCDDAGKTPVEKLAAVDSLLSKLKEAVPTGAEKEAVNLKAETDNLRKTWADAVAALTPIKELKLPDLFLNSPYEHEKLKLLAFGSPAEKNADRWVTQMQASLLKQAQSKIFAAPGITFQGQSSAKADGAPGPTTHRAILAYQSMAGKNLLPNGQLDAATLSALELGSLDIAALAEESKKAAPAATTKPPKPPGGGGGGKKPSPPPKSIYDGFGGKGREIRDRMMGKINPIEWKKHLKYDAYWEKYDD